MVAEAPENGLATVTLGAAFFGPAAHHRATQQNPGKWLPLFFFFFGGLIPPCGAVIPSSSFLLADRQARL